MGNRSCCQTFFGKEVLFSNCSSKQRELQNVFISARSPIPKKIWDTHKCEKFWLGYYVTSVRPTVRTQSHNADAPVFVWREVAWRDAFTTEMLMNTKYKVN